MRIKQSIGEFLTAKGKAIRSGFRLSSAGKFWPSRPDLDNTTIDYNFTRELYRNDGEDSKLGAGFCKPIVDLSVQFMGIPTATVDDEKTDEYLNECLQVYWKPVMQQIFRNAIRDGNTVVRFRKPLNNVLVGDDEKVHGLLEIVDPERVEIFRDPFDQDVITEAKIVHFVEVPTEDTILTELTLSKYSVPVPLEHEIWEFITPELFRYYNKTEEEWLDDLERPNVWGFVPLEEVFNEYESSLSGGQSDLESPLPFVFAFHDVLLQSLQAHKYHSIPKVNFKIKEIDGFLRNNFPASFNKDGTFSGSVNWQGKEIIFTDIDEGVGFVEATSIIGDSKTLLEFIFDCICVASETPEWAFMRVDASSSSGMLNAQSLPFRKKIERKRQAFAVHIQSILKMSLATVSNYNVSLPLLEWGYVTEDEAQANAKVFQEFVMGLEVLAQRKIISDETYRNEVRQYLKRMKSASVEKLESDSNFDIESERMLSGFSNGDTPVNAIPGGGGRNE